MRRYRWGALGGAALLVLLSLFAPGFLTPSNLKDLAVVNAPVLVAAIGMTLVILTGQIDVSIGSQFAVCGVIAGLLAKGGTPVLLLPVLAALTGAALGALNGLLAGWWRIPSIVATLATMSIFRESLRWSTGGAWVQDLPPSFQWLGAGQATGEIFILATAAAVFGVSAWGMRYLASGRAVYATGSDPEAARLAGIHPRRVAAATLLAAGLFAGLAAALNAIRFREVPTNSGLGFELKVIAAVVVGGTSVNGGRGSLWGTLAGVVLLGVIGPALTFLGADAYWEKALQGTIILAAVFLDALRRRQQTVAGQE